MIRIDGLNCDLTNKKVLIGRRSHKNNQRGKVNRILVSFYILDDFTTKGNLCIILSVLVDIGFIKVMH